MSARWLIFRLRASSIRGNTMRCGARSARVFRPSRSSPGFAPVGLSPVSSTTGRRAGPRLARSTCRPGETPRWVRRAGGKRKVPRLSRLGKGLGFEPQGLDIDEHGIRPDHFEEICNSERVSALVCTPTLNNPTVALMPDSRRRAIAHIAERYGVNVIEDDVHGALPAKAQTPIASLIPELAFYCTSMTKSVLSGLRTGYLTMPRRLALRAESILRVSS